MLSSDRASLLSSADILPVVNAPAAEDQRTLKRGAVAIGFLRPLDDPAALLPAVESGVTLLAVELVRESHERKPWTPCPPWRRWRSIRR